MKKQRLLLFVITLAAATIASAAGFTKDGNFVTINVEQPVKDGAKIVRLQVVNDNIIRVRATCEEDFTTKNSLIIVNQNPKTKFDVTESETTVTVKTQNLQAKVDKKTGDVTFLDSKSRTKVCGVFFSVKFVFHCDVIATILFFDLGNDTWNFRN